MTFGDDALAGRSDAGAEIGVGSASIVSALGAAISSALAMVSAARAGTAVVPVVAGADGIARSAASSVRPSVVVCCPAVALRTVAGTNGFAVSGMVPRSIGDASTVLSRGADRAMTGSLSRSGGVFGSEIISGFGSILGTVFGLAAGSGCGVGPGAGASFA